MHLVVYDIADNRRLQKIAKILESYGVRVQNSTFEVEVGKKTFNRMRRELEEVLDLAEDRLFIFNFNLKKQTKEKKSKTLWEVIF